MARNMRKSVKDKDHLKTVRKNARRRWRNKKANEKIQKNLVNFMKLPERCQHAGSAENRSPGEVVELPARKLEEKPQSHRSNEPRVLNDAPRVGEKEKHSPAEVVELPAEKPEEKPQSHCSDEPCVRNDAPRAGEKEKHSPAEVVEFPAKKTEEKPQSHRSDAPNAPAIKEIRQTEIVRSEKFLGCGTFGTCYLARYRGCLVTVKEFKVREKLSLDDVKKDVLHEATMITYLGDHPCLPLLFGVVTRSLPLRLVTQFHGEKEQSLTLSRAVRKKELGNQNWLEILKGIIKGLDHTHKRGILHNDLKANNVVLEKRSEAWNPVIIDFGKARFIANPKPNMSLSVSSQDAYRKRYPHIAPEIVSGKGRQSIESDIFSFGRIAVDVLDLLPTATAKSLKAANKACSVEPTKRPALIKLYAALLE